MSCVPDYMPRQRDINGKMRAILINWLIEVSAVLINWLIEVFGVFFIYAHW
jgi:hypothetical protein